MSDFSGKGWLAEIVLRYEVKRGMTRLTEKRHIGPLMVQRPFILSKVLHTLIYSILLVV